MSISSINRVFDKHGKTVLLILSVLISLAFISFFSPGGDGGCSCAKGENEDVFGSVFGRDVTRAEYSRHMEYLRMVGNENDPLIQFASGLNGIAAFDAAKQVGISVTSDEVVKFVRNRFLTPTGEVDAKAVTDFEKALKRQGFLTAQYQEAVKYYLVIRKFFSTAASAPVVTDGEKVLFGEAVNEVFSTAMAKFKLSDYTAKAVIADSQITEEYNRIMTRFTDAQKALTDANNQYNKLLKLGGDNYQEIEAVQKTIEQAKQNFTAAKAEAPMTVDTFEGLVAVFPYRNDSLRADLLLAVTDSQITDYYESNKMFEFREGTDELNPKFKPLDSVKENIRITLADRDLRRAVSRQADLFVSASEFEEIDGMDPVRRAMTFKAVAGKSNVRVESLTKFSVMSTDIPGIGSEPSVSQTLSAQIDGSSMTAPVSGLQGAFVALRTDMIPASIQAFDTAKREIQARLISATTRRLAEEAARQYSSDATIALMTGKPLSSVKGPAIEQMEDFAPNADSVPRNPVYQSIIPACLSTPAGRVTQPIALDDGFAVVHVKRTQMPNAAQSAADTGITNNLENIKQQMNFIELIQWLRENTVSRISEQE